ncbi:hypothetical protein R1flu_004847 [Riccia fluitans]|uniref:CCHC-type domain-containing protein n=1 Tax=Riccia fluitans TaxID=41844 RepID=A0ABD1YS28_9MARC
MGKVAMTKTTAPSFATFTIATPMAPEIVDLRASEPTVKAVEPGTPQIVPAVPFCFFCHKSGHTFHQGCPEYAQKFAGYRNQRGPAGQDGNGVRRPAPECKALTPVLEDSEYNQSGPLEDDKKGVGYTPEVKVNSPQVENWVACPGVEGERGRTKLVQSEEVTTLLPKPDQEQESSAGQTKQERVAVEVDRVHEIIFRQIKDAKISLTIDEITALSPVSKEFVVSRLAGELVPQHRLTPASSKYEPAREELGASSTSGVTPSEGAPVDIRAVRACYAPPMIRVRIGEIMFPGYW